MKKSLLYKRDVISTDQFTNDELEQIFTVARQLKNNPNQSLLKDKIIANCFFEPSTRTRLSFETAALRLGANVIGFDSNEATSMQKGETLSDTIRIVSEYADLIVIRHPSEGSAALAAEVADTPVVNAGDGANQHPSQALLDLFTIQENHPKINGLAIGIIGDLKYGRAVHSFVQLFSLFDVRLYLISPESLSLPDYACDNLKRSGVRFSFHQRLEDVIPKLDVLYVTRIQQERFNEGDFSFLQNPYIIEPTILEKAKQELIIMHPLPRINEIAKSVDTTSHARYFQQAANGVPIRQALLTLILNESIP